MSSMNKSININPKITAGVLIALLMVAGAIYFFALRTNDSDVSNSPSITSTPNSNGQTVSAGLLVAAPADYSGSSINFTGEVFVVEGSPGEYALQLWSNTKDRDGNIVVYTNSTKAFAEGDFVKVDGIVSDAFEGENAFGASLVAPTVIASSINKVSADTAIAPTMQTKNPGTQKSFGSLTITLIKVEYANNETRLYFTFDNTGSSDYSFYSFNAALVQDRKKIDEISDYTRDTYDYDSDFLAGTVTDVKLYYGKLDPNKPSTYTIEVTNNDTYDSQKIVFEL